MARCRGMAADLIRDPERRGTGDAGRRAGMSCVVAFHEVFASSGCEQPRRTIAGCSRPCCESSQALVSGKWPLPRFSTATSEHLDWRVRVVHARWKRGAGRRRYDLKPPFTPRWQVCVTQRPLVRIASMPATGPDRPVRRCRREQSLDGAIGRAAKFSSVRFASRDRLQRRAPYAGAWQATQHIGLIPKCRPPASQRCTVP